jgi:hypothetical protein
MAQAAAAVIDLDLFRRRRAAESRPGAAPPVAALGWWPVWVVWLPVWPMR